MLSRKPKHDYEKIYQRHLNGESLLSISKELNIHIQSIHSYIKRNNLSYNKNIQIRQSKYWVDDNYLDNVDSEDKSYFLGWMLSDGYISKNSLSLKLKSNDGYIIREVFDKFSKGFKLSTDKNSCSISISSSKLIHDLIKNGCVYNKTNIGFTLPDIPDDLFRHFVRGYFDGDGSISKRSSRPNQIQVYICSPDELFLINMQTKLLEYGIVSMVYMEDRNGKSIKLPNGNYCIDNLDMYRLILNSHKEKLKFYEFIYKNCDSKLLRKYSFYTRYYENTIELLKTKNPHTIQYVDGKAIINYDLINDNTFNLGNYIDEEHVLNLYKSGRNKFSIHKELKISRSVIERIIRQNL